MASYAVVASSLTDEMLGPWIDRADELAGEFQTAKPFPLVVLDGFLNEAAAGGLVAEFPSVEGMARTNDYIFGDKRHEPNLAVAGRLPDVTTSCCTRRSSPAFSAG